MNGDKYYGEKPFKI